jgi:hypothetical protein
MQTECPEMWDEEEADEEEFHRWPMPIDEDGSDRAFCD